MRRGLRITHLFEVSNQSRPSWAPSQPCLRLHARTDKVATNEHPQPAEVGCRLLGGFRHGWHLQAAADGVGDFPDRHALFGDRMIPGASFLLLERQPVEAGGIEDVDSRPTVESIGHIRRHSLLASQRDGVGDEALLDGVVDLGKANDRHAHATLQQLFSRNFRGARICERGRKRSIFLCRHPPLRHGRQPGGDKHWPLGAFQRTTESLDGALVELRSSRTRGQSLCE
jgi:hypothetical protein